MRGSSRRAGADNINLLCSHIIALGRGLRQTDQRQGERPEAVYGRQAEGQGGRYEGDEDGADIEEGADEGKAVR